ncbi:MAG TPA: NAD-dependent epimerase/dehydratase family protein [Gemmatimonadaceae bacterium]|jgi:NADH dehydrogenase
MKILLTGGTGVIGASAVRELHRAGHAVRVLTRHAERDRDWWPEGVEPWTGDVSDEQSIRGSAKGCDVVIHIAGIVQEDPPKVTFQSVNIEGTRFVTLEAERNGVRKLIYVSSLGAERGKSGYHRSKSVAEEVVHTFSRDWLILRPGAVYGPGDEHISVLLRMVQTLPIVPTIGDGDQKFQPIWHEDFARVLRAAVERDDVSCQRLDIAGEELTSQNDMIARLRKVTGREAVAAPIPDIIADWGVRALNAVGIDAPVSEAQLEMLVEGNVIPARCPNGLTEVFGLTPTSLDDGLRQLIAVQPEQLPSDGVGPLTMKRYWIDITNSPYDADGLFDVIRLRLPELMAEPLAVRSAERTAAPVEEGQTFVVDLPVRGQCQVRIGEVASRSLTLLTVSGHPIAGAVRLSVEPHEAGLRFEIHVFDRAGSFFDQLLMRAGGELLQRATWLELADNVAKVAGGMASGVQTDSTELTGSDAERVEAWATALAAQLSRNSTSGVRS